MFLNVCFPDNIILILIEISEIKVKTIASISKHNSWSMPSLARRKHLSEDISTSIDNNNNKFMVSPQAKEFDAVVFDICRVAAHEIAEQLTLLDLPLFQAIKPEELTSCEWTGKKKYDVCPNVVNFTKKFNQVSFWVTTEILDNQTAKMRAHKVTHFIRIAKKLMDLNNLNSSKAVVSSLYSAPIHRLTKTWNLVPKREKEKLERLQDVLSEESNNKTLREYLENVKLPCIPYLGMYLTDLTYINTVHPSTGGLDTERSSKLNQVLRVIADFQHSSYDHLETINHIQTYLSQLKYIDELQKFVEDDNYKLSLSIEPNASGREFDTSPQQQQHGETVQDGSLLLRHTEEHDHSPFLPSYKKTQSLPSRHLNITTLLNKTGPFRSPMPNKRQESDAIRRWSQTSSSGYDSGLDADETESHPLFLNRTTGHRPSMIGLLTPCVPQEYFILEGFLKRKTFLKNGSRPSVSTWRRFWVGVTSSSGHLVYFLPKHAGFRGHERQNFRSDPYKVVSLSGCTVFVCADADGFRLTDECGDTVYLFRAGSQHNAGIWHEAINEAAQGGGTTKVDDLIDLS